MSDFLLSFILGVIEGITEFLPVSSTAHLRIAEHVLGLSLEDGFWKVFSVTIQLGAILSLPVYFFKRILGFLKSFLNSSQKMTHPLSLVVLAFFVTAIPSYLLEKIIGENLESLKVMALSLILGGVVMGGIDHFRSAAEKKGPVKGSPIRIWKMEEIGPKEAALIGLAQVAAALFPGVSRSMATIAAGQMMGLSRSAALEFSFFLSMPTMAAATGFVLLKGFSRMEGPAFDIFALSAHQVSVLALGFVISFAVAWASVAFLMQWVRSRGFMPFAIYRILMGAMIFLTLI